MRPRAVPVLLKGHECSDQLLFFYPDETLHDVERELLLRVAPSGSESLRMRFCTELPYSASTALRLESAAQALPLLSYAPEGYIHVTFRCHTSAFQHYLSPSFPISRLPSFFATYCALCDAHSVTLTHSERPLPASGLLSSLDEKALTLTVTFSEPRFEIWFEMRIRRLPEPALIPAWLPSRCRGQAVYRACALLLSRRTSAFPPAFLDIRGPDDRVLDRSELVRDTAFSVKILRANIFCEFPKQMSLNSRDPWDTCERVLQHVVQDPIGHDRPWHRLQFEGRLLDSADNLAVLPSSETRQIQVVAAHLFNFRISHTGELMHRYLPNTATLRQAKPDLEAFAKVDIAHFRIANWRKEWEMADEERPMRTLRDHVIEIVCLKRITAVREDGSEISHPFLLSARAEELCQRFEAVRLVPLDPEAPASGQQSRVYCVRPLEEMIVSVSIENGVRTFSMREADQVSDLLAAIAAENGPGGWELSVDGTVLLPDRYLCEFVFRQRSLTFTARRCGQRRVLILLSGHEFHAIFNKDSLTPLELQDFVHSRFRLSGSADLQIALGGLAVTVSPSETARQCLTFVINGVEQRKYDFALDARVSDVIARLGHGCEFRPDDEQFFKDPSALLSSIPLTNTPIQVKLADRQPPKLRYFLCFPDTVPIDGECPASATVAEVLAQAQQILEVDRLAICDHTGTILSESLQIATLPEPREFRVRELPPARSAPAVHTYKFDRDGEEYSLDFPEDATVFTARESLADCYDTQAENVSLLFRGRVLRDEWPLIQQRIGDGRIIVQIRSTEEILLSSVAFQSRGGASKPPDFDAQVDRLQRETNVDRRTCGRCFAFNGYDFGATLAALRNLDD